MDEKERARRSHDFFSTLPAQLQNQLAMQKRMEARGEAPRDANIMTRYKFSRWYD